MKGSKRIVSKPMIHKEKANEIRDYFNKGNSTIEVGYGDYNLKTGEYSNIHYAKED
ncbi:MAG: hypothetical protein IPK06_04760 [Ignavibacteriae bacterium]|nr:hypothetical protein [Ignavibacteriota bacterium]